MASIELRPLAIELRVWEVEVVVLTYLWRCLLSRRERRGGQMEVARKLKMEAAEAPQWRRERTDH